MTETATTLARRDEVSTLERVFTREQVELLKHTIMPNSTDAELALLAEYAARTGLDVFAKQLIPIPTWDPKARRTRWEMYAGIDGLRLIAHRTHEYDGTDGPFYREKGGEWSEYWDSAEPPYECKVVVFRKDSSRGFAGRVRYDNFVRTNKDGEVYGPWKTMAAHMLSIRAESHALRKAFPRETSGLDVEYGDEQPPVHIVNPDSPISPAQIGKLHELAKAWGWSEDRYRDELEKATGRRTSTELTKGQAHEVIETWTRSLEDGWDVAEGELVDEENSEAGAAAVRSAGSPEQRHMETPSSASEPYPTPCGNCGSQARQEYHWRKNDTEWSHKCHDCGWSSGWQPWKNSGAEASPGRRAAAADSVSEHDVGVADEAGALARGRARKAPNDGDPPPSDSGPAAPMNRSAEVHEDPPPPTPAEPTSEASEPASAGTPGSASEDVEPVPDGAGTGEGPDLTGPASATQIERLVTAHGGGAAGKARALKAANTAYEVFTLEDLSAEQCAALILKGSA